MVNLSPLAGLHVKLRFFFTVLFKQLFFLLLSPFFCLSQQKKRTIRKALLKRTSISGFVNRLYLVVCSQQFSKSWLNRKSRRSSVLQDQMEGPDGQRCEETVRIQHGSKVPTTSRGF